MSSKKRKSEEVEAVEEIVYDENGEHKKKKKKKNKEKDERERKEIEEAEQLYEEEVHEEIHEGHEEDNAHEIEHTEEWPKEDIIELVRRMQTQIPEKDTLRYTSRAEKVDWDKVQFGSYSADDCYNKWRSSMKKIRSYRLLHEVLEDIKVWADKPWSDFYSRGKKKRHPDHPTRPLSSYMLFYMAQKNKVARKNPKMKMTDISKIIGEKYNSLPEHKKARYVETAKKMQEEYRTELEKFYQKHPEEVPKPKKTENAKSRKEAGVPAKPLTPFKLFYNKRHEEHKNDVGFDQHAFLEKCKEQWKHLSDRKKKFWIQWALEEEAKYVEDLAAYSSAHNEEVPLHPAKSVLTKEEKHIWDRLSGKPEKPPNSAYSLFSREKLKKKDSSETPRNRMKEIAKEWALVPPQEKQKYGEQVQLMLETYKLEFANYLENLSPEKRAEELAKSQPKRKASAKPKAQSGKEKVNQKNKKKLRTLYKGEPELPPRTVFDLYEQLFAKENSHMSAVQCQIEAAAQWKKLSQAEKDKYQRKREQAKSEYIQKYETFILSLNEAELKEYSVMKAKEDKLTSESSDRNEYSEGESEDSSDEKETNKDEEDSSSSSSSSESE